MICQGQFFVIKVRQIFRGIGMMAGKVAVAYQRFNCGLCGRSHSCQLDFRNAILQSGKVLVRADKVGKGCSQWFYVEFAPARYAAIARKLGLEFLVDQMNL